MDGSLEPAPIKATPDNPKKRIASRSPSISPSQAQQLKKICHEDDDQGINDHKGRSSPEPTPQDNDELYDMEAGASEAKVEDFVRNNVIPPSSGIDKIKRSDRVFVGRAIIPITNPYARISVPVPDLLYGYRLSAFEQDQRMQIATCGNFAFANSEGLTFPFFAVEFKGDGPSSKGSL
ncbi:hypothetical protein LZL87_002882 [Fusarium oxysporum]|nr:hypothetical protein LZL87_002882 [Fusarium oxysporum]